MKPSTTQRLALRPEARLPDLRRWRAPDEVAETASSISWSVTRLGAASSGAGHRSNVDDEDGVLLSEDSGVVIAGPVRAVERADIT